MSSENMQWMYNGLSGLVDPEEYLMGRKIDKTFEIVKQVEQQGNERGDLVVEGDHVPISVFAAAPSTKASVTIDLESKMREDPLYDIRKHQQEQRKQLLNNPMKMKRIKTLLESTLMTDLKKNLDDGNDSDDEDRRKESKKSRHDRDHERRHDKDSDRRKESEQRSYRSTESSSSRSRHHTKIHSNDDRHRRKDDDHRSSSKSKKLAADEMEKRRKEMMNNAEWRDSHRRNRIKEAKERNEKNDKMEGSKCVSQFIKPLLEDLNNKDSLEKRIKQKMFTAQRGSSSMETNFACK